MQTAATTVRSAAFTLVAGLGVFALPPTPASAEVARSASGFGCLDINMADPRGSGGRGRNVIVWPQCHGGGNQNWQYDNGILRAEAGGQQWCLDIDMGAPAAPDGRSRNIIAWPQCHGGGNQRWLPAGNGFEASAGGVRWSLTVASFEPSGSGGSGRNVVAVPDGRGGPEQGWSYAGLVPQAPVTPQAATPAPGAPALEPLGPFALRNVGSSAVMGQGGGGSLSLTVRDAGQSDLWMIEPLDAGKPPSAVRLGIAPGTYLAVTGGGLALSTTDPRNQWVMEKRGDFFRFRARYDPERLLAVRRGMGLTLASEEELGFDVSAALWSLGSIAQPQATAAAEPTQREAAPVQLLVANYSGAPLDLFAENAAGELGFVDTIPPGQGFTLPAVPGATVRLGQFDQWVGAYVTTTEPEQVVPFGQ